LRKSKLKKNERILYLSILLHYYTLHTIILFPSQCNLEELIRTLSFLTTCFGPSWPSSGVSSYAKTVKLDWIWEVRKWYWIQLGPKHVRKESVRISVSRLHRDRNNIIVCKEWKDEMRSKWSLVT
jgi:hypothetical protein